MSGFIQIGVTALRDPVTMEFLPSVPIYIRKADVKKQPELETLDLYDIGKVLGKKFEQYKKECEKEGVPVG